MAVDTAVVVVEGDGKTTQRCLSPNLLLAGLFFASCYIGTRIPYCILDALCPSIHIITWHDG